MQRGAQTHISFVSILPSQFLHDVLEPYVGLLHCRIKHVQSRHGLVLLDPDSGILTLQAVFHTLSWAHHMGKVLCVSWVMNDGSTARSACMISRIGASASVLLAPGAKMTCAAIVHGRSTDCPI